MNVIEYEKADGSIDYAPESYLNQGCFQIARNIERDERVIKAISATSPSAGFDFDDYVRSCREFDRIRHRNAVALGEAF